MDGRGRYLDNIFVERLWRSVKYENVYLCGYQTIPEARRGLTTYFEFYNKERYHQSLNNKTPSAVYTGSVQKAHEAALNWQKFSILKFLKTGLDKPDHLKDWHNMGLNDRLPFHD